MSSDSLLPYYTAQSGSAMGLFNTAMGKLQRQLYKGEYDVFKYAPIFESDFIQITRRGEVIDVHNRVRMVTVGVACTSPVLALPDVMLLARPATGCDEDGGQAPRGRGRKATKTLELTRLLPLKFVKISVHDREKQQLRLKFATGRSCYLQLCPPLDAREDLFAYWEKLIYLLRPPVDSNSSTHAIPAGDMICMPVWEKREDRPSPAAVDVHGKGDQDQVSVRSLHVFSEVSGVTSAAFAGGEGIQNASHKPTPNTRTSPTAGAVSMAAAGSSGPQQTNMAMAEAAAKDPRGSKTSLAIAGAANTSSKSIKVAVAEAASRFSEPTGTLEDSVSLSPEASKNVEIAGAESTVETVAETAGEPARGPPVSPLPSEGAMSEQHRSQRGHQPNIATRREQRARRERREKDTAVSRRGSRHSRTGKSRHKTEGDKMSRKSSSRSVASRRATRRDKKDKSRGSPRGSRHSSAHKGVSRTPISKESRTSHKLGRSLSTTSSGSTTKRLSRISSFLRNVRASLTTRTGASLRDRGVDIVSKTVEKSNLEAIMETAEGNLGLEITGTMTSATMEAVTFETH
ncbi:Golgi-associated RAB2 interactor protein 4 [Elephas maximus indicus]|uniref:Golgi-associated RAB2 interactor protein 4 n=1 Tax=Elephas maximus indicus TaxID=99487 RepID=UPI002116A766|nr:Golgi-associated RAB2 interactor protein 4 [Elephas maximus indicus]